METMIRNGQARKINKWMDIWLTKSRKTSNKPRALALLTNSNQIRQIRSTLLQTKKWKIIKRQ